MGRRAEPEAAVAPICVAGFTDSHWLREAFGTVAYGFFPLRTWIRRSRRGSSTRPTSAFRSTTSSSA